jgi:hypothetical protein
MTKVINNVSRFSRKHEPGKTNTAPFQVVVTKAVQAGSTEGFIGNKHPGLLHVVERHWTTDENGELVVKEEERWTQKS